MDGYIFVLNISLKCNTDLAKLYFTNMLTKTEQTVHKKDVTLRVNPYFILFYIIHLSHLMGEQLGLGDIKTWMLHPPKREFPSIL